MNPIIHPIWFYLINLTTGLTGVSAVIAVFAGIATIIMGVMIPVEMNMRTPNEKLIAFLKRNVKKSFIIGIIFVVIAIFTPSEKACYQMMVASIVTPNNIETVIDTTKDGVGWLVDTITEASEKLSNSDESAD